jgi:hypothetical protein
MKKILILFSILLLSLTGCVHRDNVGSTWGGVPGGIEVRQITEVEPDGYKMSRWNSRTNVLVPVRYRVQVFQVPVQVVRWWNPVSNVWETVEQPLTPPRLISETFRTNGITK